MGDEILVPEEDLESEEDKFGFKMFVKALFCLLKLDEVLLLNMTASFMRFIDLKMMKQVKN